MGVGVGSGVVVGSGLGVGDGGSGVSVGVGSDLATCSVAGSVGEEAGESTVWPPQAASVISADTANDAKMSLKLPPAGPENSPSNRNELHSGIPRR